MTTIAANLECMAADQRVTGDGPYYHADKIFRVGESLFGTAGDGFMSLVMVEWLKTSRSRPALYKQWADYDRECIVLLELNPRGLFIWNGWGIAEKLNEVRFAIGSGAMAAIKGMDSGESPQQAVKSAPDYDEFTGPPIQVEFLKPKRKR